MDEAVHKYQWQGSRHAIKESYSNDDGRVCCNFARHGNVH